MTFDSEEQKKAVLDLIARVPIETTLQGLFAGPADELKELVQTLQNAEVENPPELTPADKKAVAAAKRKAAGDKKPPTKKTPRRSGQKSAPKG